MSKKLNEIPDEAAESTIQRAARNLQVRAASPYDSLSVDERYRHASAVSGMYLKSALSKYQLDYPALEVAHDLASGAHWKATEIDVVATEGLTKPSTWSLFLHDVGLVAAFGSPDDLSRFSAYPSNQVTGTPDAEAPGCEVARLWKDVLGTDRLPRDALVKQLLRCESDHADRWDRQWTHGIARSLIALDQQDSNELNAGLAAIVSFTRQEALRGDWQRLGAGQVSLVGLAICRMALERGTKFTLDSLYVPVALVERAS